MSLANGRCKKVTHLVTSHWNKLLLVIEVMFTGTANPGMPMKRKMENDMMSHSSDETRQGPKKPRLVFTDIQRRTLHKETKRPTKDMQVTIGAQLGLEVIFL